MKVSNHNPRNLISFACCLALSPVFVIALSTRALCTDSAIWPSPPHEKTGVSPEVVLRWTPGDSVASYVPGQWGNGHHVFFHTNYSWVNGANLNYPLLAEFGHFRADSNSWAPGDPVFGLGTMLETDETYWWRIIEANDSNVNSPWKSDVWTFKTIEPNASNPNPHDGQLGVSLSSPLTWTPGTAVAYSPSGGHDLYFGTAQNDVENADSNLPLYPASVYMGRQDANDFMPSMIGVALELSTEYYWRIDEANDISGTVEGRVWNFKTRGTTACVPSPASGEVVGELQRDVVDVTLSWIPGAFAADINAHEVYFGTSFDEVNDINASDPDPNSVYIGRMSSTQYQLEALALDVTYYWRVDEVNDSHPDVIWKGNVWSFKTDSGTAKFPVPEDGEGDVGVNADLEWTAGFGAISHDIYFGTSTTPVYVGIRFQVAYDPGTLTYQTTYYWRIDENNVYGTRSGPLWSFTTALPPAQAHDPDPPDGGYPIEDSLVLSWVDGYYAVSHDVYFGTDFNDVNDADTTVYNPNDVYKGRQGQSQYQLQNLEFGVKYYWRVDEVNDLDVWEGPVWSFTYVPLLPAGHGVRRMLAWNIEFLGSRDPLRTQEQLDALAERILTFDASILALQEISVLSTLEYVRSQLGFSWEIFHSGSDDNALLYDTSQVELLSAEMLTNLSTPPYTEYPGVRRPVTGIFRPIRMYAEPFRVIGVHCTPFEPEIRDAEGRWLHDKVAEYLADPTEVNEIVLLGDLNAVPNDPPHNRLQEGGFLQLLPKLNGDTTEVGGGRAGIDHVYVTQGILSLLTRESTFVIRNNHYGETLSEFEATYSDHFPIFIDLAPAKWTNFIGLAMLAEHWHDQNCDSQNGWCGAADLTRDGRVDWDDVSAFSEAWLTGL